MENSIYLGLSKQMVLKTNMDIVANNIANMGTTGFRAQTPIFQEYISDPKYSDDKLSFVQDYGQYQTTDAGPIEQTGNPFHVALNGPGFMGITMPDGSTKYTRDGNFQKTAEGILINSDGLPVLGQGGAITIPITSTTISIDSKGNIYDQTGNIGQLQIIEFDNVQELEPVGNNLYKSDGGFQTATKTKVIQSALEKSNVNSITEITRMIKILRDFQDTQELLNGEHERLRGAIQQLTQG